MSGINESLPDISVIIPIYNVEAYIEDCARSLFEQTLNNIEFIFIDDASTDKSVEKLEKILSQYPERKSHARIIRHKKNKGISYTREEGVTLSKGNWVIHCDSDDTIDKNAYKTLLDASESSGADIVVCSYKLFGNHITDRIKNQGEGYLSSENFIENLDGIGERVIHGALWNKLIKRDLWKKNDLGEDLSFCEDEVALHKITLRNPDLKIFFIPEVLYNYRVREDSLTFRNDEKRKVELKKLISIYEVLILDSPDNYKKAIRSKILRILFLLLTLNPDLEEFSSKYGHYRKYIKGNRSLNYFRKLQLQLGLRGYTHLNNIIGKCNQIGLKSLLAVRKFRKV